jgi:hypothetical protein
VETVPRRYRPEADLGEMGWATGRTIRCTVAVRPIRTVPQQIDSAAPLAEIRWPNAKPVPGNKLPGRVGI